MAVQSSFYVPDGSTRTFPSTKHIATKQHVGAYLQRALDSIWETALSTSYELVNNSIVFDSAVDNVLYIQIEIRVVDTTAELIDSPSTIALVAASIADVNTVADSILDVNTVADNISSVQNTSAINADISTVASVSTNVTTVAGISTSIPTVAGISANVTTVAGISANVTTVANSIANVNTNATNIANINSVAITVVPNIAEILLANDNATTATTQAGIATTQATNASSSATQSQLYEWEAEAERLTADSYATEAEDTFVNIVTSDGDGTFTYTPTTDYSALHWAAKAATFNPALYAPLASSDITVTVGSGGQYATINLALAYLSALYPLYKNTGVTATISLLTGFVMAEQVLVRGLDFGWVTITGVDAETTITHTSLTTNFTLADYGSSSYPAFGVSRGGTLPRIGQLFRFSATGVGGNKHGVMAIGARSSAEILPSKGVISAGAYGIHATQGSTISASSANASGAGSTGILATQGSTIEAYSANASGAGSYGIFAAYGSTIEAYSANARKNGVSDQTTDFYVTACGIIAANSGLGGTNVTVNTVSASGIIFK